MVPLLQQGCESVSRTLDYHQQAMAHVSRQYATDTYSQAQLADCLELMYNAVTSRGKIVVCGIGKLFKIANKFVATMNLLLIPSQPLHPGEALHGDLGLIHDDRDCLVLVTALGNTPELLQLLPHLLPELPIVLLTCLKTLKLATHPMVNGLLYVDLPVSLNEESIHGLPAPTVLTSMLLVLADAATLALSEMLEADVLKRKTQFSKKHPGGLIGLNLSHLNDNRMELLLQALATLLLLLSQFAPIAPYGALLVESDDDGLVTKLDRVLLVGLLLVLPLELPLQGNPALLLLIRSLSLVVRVPREQVAAFEAKDEAKVLRWMAVYEYLVVADESGDQAVPMMMVRKLYQQFAARGEVADEWDGFKVNLLLALVPVSA